jgi:LPXTG-site transpeptidase (sortase) family protein
VTLTGISLSDDNDNDDMSCVATTIAVGGSTTCTATHTFTQSELDANGSPTAGSGNLTNNVTASSNEAPDATDSLDIPITQNPALTLAKSITSGDPYTNVGDVLNYSFLVTNTGNVTLDGPFTVADNRATDESCPATATLAPGASITCTASYMVTQTNINNGSVTNTATASGSFGGNPVTSNPDSETANAAVPIVIDPGVTKSGNPLTAQVGDTVTFTLFIFNTGNADADNVVVTDVVPGFLGIIQPVVVSWTGSGPSPPVPVPSTVGNMITIDFGTIAPSDSWTVTIITVVTQGTPPGGTNDVTLSSEPPDADLNNNDDEVFITITSGGGGEELPETGFAPDRETALPGMPSNFTYREYGELTLEIPNLDLETTIVGVPKDENGWDVTWLWDKAGYLSGTAFPTWSGNSVITGHVVLANGLEGPFADLNELEYGDAVIVHGWGEQYVYEIREVDVVSPYDPSVLRHEEYPWLTLVTCAGFDETSDSYRWRVVARAVMLSIELEAGNWTSSSSPEQHDIQTFDRVGSGGVQP